jgi:hypothetical protein
MRTERSALRRNLPGSAVSLPTAQTPLPPSPISSLNNPLAARDDYQLPSVLGLLCIVDSLMNQLVAALRHHMRQHAGIAQAVDLIAATF